MVKCTPNGNAVLACDQNAYSYIRQKTHQANSYLYQAVGLVVRLVAGPVTTF